MKSSGLYIMAHYYERDGKMTPTGIRMHWVRTEKGRSFWHNDTELYGSHRLAFTPTGTNTEGIPLFTPSLAGDGWTGDSISSGQDTRINARPTQDVEPNLAPLVGVST